MLPEIIRERLEKEKKGEVKPEPDLKANVLQKIEDANLIRIQCPYCLQGYTLPLSEHDFRCKICKKTLDF